MNNLDCTSWKDLLGFDCHQIEEVRFTGFFYIKQGKYDIAKNFFEALIAMQAQDANAQQNAYDYHMLGALYLELGNYKRSIRYLEKALQLDENDWAVKLNRMYCLFSLNRIVDGLEYARELSESDNSHLANSAQAFILAWSSES